MSGGRRVIVAEEESSSSSSSDSDSDGELEGGKSRKHKHRRHRSIKAKPKAKGAKRAPSEWNKLVVTFKNRLGCDLGTAMKAAAKSSEWKAMKAAKGRRA